MAQRNNYKKYCKRPSCHIELIDNVNSSFDHPNKIARRFCEKCISMGYHKNAHVLGVSFIKKPAIDLND
jgi:hypothetical protein